MTSPSTTSVSREPFANLPTAFPSSRGLRTAKMKMRVNVCSNLALRLGWAGSGRRMPPWAAGVSLLMLLLCLSPQAFSQSCTGLCLQQTSCPGSETTSISGTVYAPNGVDPLPNVVVYVPNGGPAPNYGVTYITSGVACYPNGEPLSGSPLVSTTSGTNGTFTLNNMPVGANIPLVI